MADRDFEAKISRSEVTVAHVAEGHTFRFPVMSNGTVSLHGVTIEPNLSSSREARRFLAEAYVVARTACHSGDNS
jgi:hypothetical protein